MLLENNQVDITEFLKITAAGVRFASFTEIRDALIIRYKDAYGQDIDVSTSSADGVFINNTALLINNILQTMKSMYGNLDVNTATGAYLDALCRLSNIVRKGATCSTADIIISNSLNRTINARDLVLVDKAGITWRVQGDVTIPAYSTQLSRLGVVSVTAVCEELGPVEAPAGWIDRVAQINSETSYLTIEQPSAARVGETAESDSSLRARRSKSVGIQGTTILESLVGELLSLTGIKDVKIVENQNSSNSSCDDGTILKSHSIYIVLRYDDAITVDNATIGNIIYQKLTPGILTNQYSPASGSPTSGTSKSYDTSTLYPSEVVTVLGNYNIYWKRAIPVSGDANYDIIAQITVNDNFNKGTITYTTSEYKMATGDFAVLCQALDEYVEALPLGAKLVKNDLLFQLVQASPEYKGYPACAINSINSNKFDATNPLTYYNYSYYGVRKGADDETYYIKLSSVGY